MPLLNKTTKINSFYFYSLLLIIAETASWLSFNFRLLNLFILIFLFVLAFILVYRKPEYALYLSLAELFWGASGHSFEYSFISTRLVIFSAIVVAFFCKHFNRFRHWKILREKAVWRIFLGLIFLVALALVVGLINRHPIANVFWDANAYFYLLYLPIWYEFYDPSYLKNIITILLSAALVLSLKTLMIFNLYAQGYGDWNLYSFYQWIRDSRTGEITIFGQDFWRVFMPAQLYILFAGIIVFIKQFYHPPYYRAIFFLGAFLAALYVSLSRSFWLGGIVAGLLFLINFVILNHSNFHLAIWLRIIPILMLGFFLVEIFYNLPQWHSPHILTRRSVESGEAAANSRLQLLPVLGEAIKNSPWIGYGFAKELTYRSSDPRIKNADNPEGWHTTYALEWGWLDQWLKGGLLFMLAFLSWVFFLARRNYQNIRRQATSSLAMISILGALVSVHIFSPYINHPLGLGALMVITIVSTHGQSS